ncbi:MAG: heavy metal translocating P-type ATPase, partial [Candidatus Bathyarchaeia archaeon]
MRRLGHSHEHHGEEGHRLTRAIIITSSSILLITGFYLEFFLSEHLLSEVAFLIATAISGYEIARIGLSTLIFDRRFSINLLILIAAVGAFTIGHGEEGATVAFLFYVAEALEDYASERARSSIEALMELAPEVAVVRRNGDEVEVPVHDVGVDEVVLIRPGERIPLDGIVVKGISSVNQAPITGESVPVLKEVESEVYAGTLNNEGFLEVRVTKAAEDTVLSKIVELVEEAQLRRSKTERLIDIFSRYYTPSVVLLAALVATVPPIALGLPPHESIYRALVILILACPCALAISTPVSMVSAITSAARNGVLIKGSIYVEEVGKARVFAFDKTGTLTEGKLEVIDVIPLSGSKDEVLARAASLEALSEHPIAKAMVERAKNEGLTLESVEDFKSFPGKGVRGMIRGDANYVGSVRLFRELSINFPEDKTEELVDEGKTVVMIGNEKEATGIISLMDKVRDATVKCITDLERQGVRTEMITGDNERTADAIAKRIGIDEYHAELLPEDKVKIVGEELMERYGRVVMVGDGVNDAPALATASVGIAMGAIGSDVSLENSDIALMEDDLSKLPYLVELSKKTLNVVRQNILASILVKGVFAILAVPGLVTLWLAVGVG